jgi:hypothetical protein
VTATATRFALLREVFDLAKQQRHALDAEELERFQDLLERRQVLIDELEAISPTDEDGLPENVILFPGPRISDDDDQLALDTLIRGILEHDRQNETILHSLLSGIRDELGQLQHGRAAVARYGSTAREGFIDRVS